MKNHHHNGRIHSTSPNARGVIHESIAARAYELWEASGKPENQADVLWLEAEQELVTGRKKPPVEAVLPVSF
jgi:Protein of unknown function (DUF2934)